MDSIDFILNSGSISLKSLFGFSCAGQEKTGLTERISGIISVSSSCSRYEADDLEVIDSSLNGKSAEIILESSDKKLRILSCWSLSDGTGILSRRDKVINVSGEKMIILKCLARFAFPPADYEIYVQKSSWARESQGRWQDIFCGTLVLECVDGRTTDGSAPFICFREKNGLTGLSFNLVPCGQWMIRTALYPLIADSLPYCVIEMGPADENLKMELLPGEEFELPEILIGYLDHGIEYLGAHRTNKYILKNKYRSLSEDARVVYNTWFDAAEHLLPERLNRQLDAAADLGCEIFVVDAGWYGTDTGSWYNETGYWEEKQKSAFAGRMSDFADSVRRKGLEFGLWMEPERFGSDVPVVKKHPHWFKKCSMDKYYPDLENSEVSEYLYDQITAMIERYGVKWLKLDFNNHLGTDITGKEFSGYYKALYLLIDKLKKNYPDVFFEGCASGGSRLDINTCSRFDGHLLTDNADPVAQLRIMQGTILRLPPGRLTIWSVLRYVGSNIPGKDTKPIQPEEVLFGQLGSSWSDLLVTDADFSARVAMTGILGLSGDIASFPDKLREKMRRNIALYKKWRGKIKDSAGYLLTPPEPIENRCGWAAIQLRDEETDWNLVFAYRLNDQRSTMSFKLFGLDEEARYMITDADNEADTVVIEGRKLMDEGLSAACDKKYRARIFEIYKEI